MILKSRSRSVRRLLLGILLMIWMHASADTEDQLRVSIGIKLFPSVLAADTRIYNKKTESGVLHLVVVYQSHITSAEAVVNKMGEMSSLRGIPVRISIHPVTSLGDLMRMPVAGVFIAESLGSELSMLMEIARINSVIVFSPFEGDVERGVHSGMSVRDKILPYLNRHSLDSANIRLKAFFLKVAEVYE